MTYTDHWCKAMTVSFFLHIFLIIAAGYLLSGLTVPLPVPAEVLLEMDLVNDPAEHAGNRITTPEQTAPPAAPQPVPTEIPPVVTPKIETPVTEPQPVVTSSELSLAAVENQTDSPSPNHSASTGSPAAAPAAGGGSRSGIAAPGILSKVDPAYPPSARKAGLEGTVILKIQIHANGRPGEITVARSTGHAVLDEAAIKAVGKWQFIPAKDRTSGRTVSCTTTLPVTFRLH
jgi:protein TonB